MYLEIYKFLHFLFALFFLIPSSFALLVFLRRSRSFQVFLGGFGIYIAGGWAVFHMIVLTFFTTPDLKIRGISISLAILIFGGTLAIVGLATGRKNYFTMIRLVFSLLGSFISGMFFSDALAVNPILYTFVPDMQGYKSNFPPILIFFFLLWLVLFFIITWKRGLIPGLRYFISRTESTAFSRLPRSPTIFIFFGSFLAFFSALSLPVLYVFGSLISLNESFQLLQAIFTPITTSTLSIACCLILLGIAIDPITFLGIPLALTRSMKEGDISIVFSEMGKAGPTPLITSGFTFLDSLDEDERYSYIMRLTLIAFSLVGLGREKEPGSAIISVPSYSNYTGIAVSNHITEEPQNLSTQKQKFIVLIIVIPQTLEWSFGNRNAWEERFDLFVDEMREVDNFQEKELKEFVLHTLLTQSLDSLS